MHLHLRASELVSLPLAAVQCATDTIIVRGKSSKERMVPIGEMAKIRGRAVASPSGEDAIGQPVPVALPFRSYGRSHREARLRQRVEAARRRGRHRPDDGDVFQLTYGDVIPGDFNGGGADIHDFKHGRDTIQLGGNRCPYRPSY